jgi:hypothetical protein
MLVSCVFSFAAVAQVTKGDLLLGGSFGFVSANNGNGTNSSTVSNVNFYPRINLGVGDNSIIGTKLGYNYSSNNGGSGSNKSHNNAFSVALFYKKLLPIKGKLGWYPEIDANFFTSKNKVEDFAGSTTTFSSHGFGAAIVPGLYYTIGPKFLINVDFGGLGYNQSKGKLNSGATSTSRNFQLALFQNFNFGFDVIIGSKRG